MCFNRMVKRAAVAAKLGIKTHAHMLRHPCGYKLANDGIDTRALQA
jgi:site-specific recombinase XerD